MGLRLFRMGDELDGVAGGPPAGPALLSLDLAPEPSRPPVGPRDRLTAAVNDAGRRLRKAHDAIETRWEHWDLIPDLAEDIGSKRWWRGAATMLGLGLLAMSFWPDFSRVEAATTQPADGAVRDQLRSQMIMPLTLGGETGARMAPGRSVRSLTSAPERPRVALTTTLGQDDGLAAMLRRAGVGPADIAETASLVGTAVPLGSITPGTTFAITLGQRSQPDAPRSLERVTFRARFGLDLTIERKAGALALVRHPVAVDTTPLRITGTVGGGLYRSARAAGAPAKAIQQYLEALYARNDLENDIAPGDRFDIVVAYRRAANGESEVGDLIYAGLERSGGQAISLLRWGKDGRLTDAADLSQPTSGARLFAPVNGHITSGYGLRRHPILGYVRMHAGIDFGAAWGSPIFAVSDGMVIYAGRHGGHGNYVRLDHGGGLGTGYGHMSRIAVSPGERVHAGEVIGYVGSSGLSTGPHLHYELYRNGQTVNPMSVTFMAKAPMLDKGEAEAFRAKLKQIKQIAAGKALRQPTTGKLYGKLP